MLELAARPSAASAPGGRSDPSRSRAHGRGGPSQHSVAPARRLERSVTEAPCPAARVPGPVSSTRLSPARRRSAPSLMASRDRAAPRSDGTVPPAGRPSRRPAADRFGPGAARSSSSSTRRSALPAGWGTGWPRPGCHDRRATPLRRRPAAGRPGRARRAARARRRDGGLRRRRPPWLPTSRSWSLGPSPTARPGARDLPGAPAGARSRSAARSRPTRGASRSACSTSAGPPRPTRTRCSRPARRSAAPPRGAVEQRHRHAPARRRGRPRPHRPRRAAGRPVRAGASGACSGTPRRARSHPARGPRPTTATTRVGRRRGDGPRLPGGRDRRPRAELRATWRPLASAFADVCAPAAHGPVDRARRA